MPASIEELQVWSSAGGGGYGGHREPDFPRSWNLYSYVEASPLRYTDPQGLQLQCTLDDSGNLHCQDEPGASAKAPEIETIEITLNPIYIRNPRTGAQLQREFLGDLTAEPVAAEDEAEYCSAFDSFAECVKKRTESYYGLAGAGVSLEAAGARLVPTRAKLGGATRGTSIASVVFRDLLPFRLPRQVRNFTFLGSIAKTKTLGGALGRAIPYIGDAVLAIDAALIGRCARQRDPLTGGRR
ncbi:MAG: hypothetical protein U0002_19680 [Thermoanaerobaculia bacterium]